MAAQERGKVKWFNTEKGYGFIEREDEKDIFVHYTDINSQGYRSLEEGQEVLFTVGEGRRGPAAKDVIPQ